MVSSIKQFIPKSELERLAQGSHEDFTRSVGEAIRAQAVAIFGRETNSKVVATFADSAIVMSEDVAFKRVYFDFTDQRLTIRSIEEVTVPHYTTGTLDDFITRESQRIVEALLGGNKVAASQELRGLAGLVETKAIPKENDVVASFVAEVRKERLWRKLLEAKRPDIARLICNELAGLDEKRLRPKFGQLYDHSIAEHALNGYRNLVRSDMVVLQTRVSGLLESAKTSMATLQQSKTASPKYINDEVLVNFGVFVEDLVDDLRVINDILIGSNRDLHGTSNLARLYDAVVEDLYTREVASSFAKHTVASVIGT